jgi:hypothetical protein
MTTLMVLMAGLTLGSDVTERIPTETEQRLAIDGYWEGILQTVSNDKTSIYKVRLEPASLTRVYEDKCRMTYPCNWTDDGQGTCRLVFANGDSILYGIYKREGRQLTICYQNPGYGRPAKFRVDQAHNLLILKPAKPPKK